MRAILAVIVGIAVSFSVILLMEQLGMKLFPYHPKVVPNDIVSARSALNNMPVPMLLIILLGHGLGMFLGGFVSNLIEPKSLNALLLIFLLVLLFTISTLAMYPHQLWFNIADISIVLIAALIAWRGLNWR
jgi:hypothetical protein